MTKIRLSLLLLIAGIVFVPLFAAAATLSLSPANVNVKQGQTFNMTVALNPQGQASYTVKVELDYPANLLEVQSFNFGSGWLPLTQSGYDLIDNANGRLVKTAGYPGGVSGPAAFGTISFRAKTSGSGNVTISANSSVFDAASQNVLTGAPVSASVTVSAPAAPATTTISGEVVSTPTPTPAEENVEEEESEDAVETIPEVGITQPEEELVGITLLAAIGELPFNLWLLLILLATTLLALFILWLLKRRKEDKNKQKPFFQKGA